MSLGATEVTALCCLFRIWPKAAKALTAILCDQSTVNFHLLEFILAIFV